MALKLKRVGFLFQFFIQLKEVDDRLNDLLNNINLLNNGFFESNKKRIFFLLSANLWVCYKSRAETKCFGLLACSISGFIVEFNFESKQTSSGCLLVVFWLSSGYPLVCLEMIFNNKNRSSNHRQSLQRMFAQNKT